MQAAGDPVTEKLTAASEASDDPAAGRHERSGTVDPNRTRVMLLGSGEYSRELAIAFQRLGAEVIAVEGYADAPAHRVADQSLVLSMTNTDELADVIGRLRPHFVVAVTDVVTADALNAAAETGFAHVFPTARSARLTGDRESLRRLAADELGLPTAPFWFAGSLDELRAVAEHAGYPLRVQPVTPRAGQRESVISGPHEVEQAWQRAASERVLAETIVDVDFHVTLLAVRSQGASGPVIEFCAPIGHSAATGEGSESWQPQEIRPAALDAAKSIAARIVKSLGGRGLFGVELMVDGDEVYFCDVSVRPYECALVTLRTQRLSAFELQARSIMGLAGDTIMISPGAAQLLCADRGAAEWPPGVGPLAEALAVPESDVWIFGCDVSGHADDRPMLGVAVVTGKDVTAARDGARQVLAALGKR
jgi:phosphoribosylglycinamide formyltransferase 2